MKKEIKEGERIPFGHGFCWYNYNRNTITTALVPFNLILRWVRQLYLYLASSERAKVDEAIRNKLHARYSEGYEDGERNGRAYTVREVGNALREGIPGMEKLIHKWVDEKYYFDK